MEMLDYVVVGSGIAGMHAAYRLNQQGKKVVVLEKESWVGGRMMTVTVGGHQVDYGAKIVANYNKYMLSLAKELGIQPVPRAPVTFSILREGKLYPLDPSKKIGFLFNRAISFRAKVQLVLGVLVLLVKYRNLDFYDLEKAIYLDDKSTYDDLRKLIGAEAFDYIVEPFSQNVVFYGTKEFSRAFLYSFIPKVPRLKTFSFSQGIGQLNQKMAESVLVQLNVQVKVVRRTPMGVMVTAVRNGKEVVYQTKRVVLAVQGNRVLEILADPLSEEKDFFSQVRYASTVQIIGTAKTDFFADASSVWTVPKENLSFSSIDSKPWPPPTPGSIFFHAALKGSVYRRLLETGMFDFAHLQDLIQKEFPRLKDVRVVDMQVWESATPILYPGYLTKAVHFLNRLNGDNRIHFCGDYLENPSTEGALTSSVKLLRRIAAR
jgi:oxygen-dependent protoporphyrinogen oxidase